MRQISSRLRFGSVLSIIFLFIPLSSFAQTRTTWSTANDIRTGARGAMVGSVSQIQSSSFTLVPDRDRSGPTARILTDTIATRYLGFGDTAGTVFSGTSGFSQLRVNDRVEVRGIGDTRNTIAAEEVLLLGRPVTPSEESITVNATRTGTVEGVVRSIRAEDNRIVIETDRREMLTILGTSSTPVYFEGGTYRIRNIEVGDRIRVEIESSSSSGIRARLIDVVKDATPENVFGESQRTVTSVYGEVTRIDSRAQTFRLEDDRGREIRVDARAAYDRAGNRFRVTDLQVGDRLDVSGEYDSAGNFRADTIRFSSERDRQGPIDPDYDDLAYSSVAIRGTVDEVFADNTIVVREDTGERDRFPILIDKNFVVRNRAGSYIRATQLRRGDRVEVQAFRDRGGSYIAQVIRIR